MPVKLFPSTTDWFNICTAAHNHLLMYSNFAIILQLDDCKALCKLTRFCSLCVLQHSTICSCTATVHAAGIAGVANMDEPRSNSSSVQVSYPAYPTLQPITSDPPASSYAQYTSPPQQDYSQGHNHFDRGSQPSPYQQQVHQQPQLQQQQQQPYRDLNGSQSPYEASPYGQQPVQAQSSYQQVRAYMLVIHACRLISCLLLIKCSLNVLPCVVTEHA